MSLRDCLTLEPKLVACLLAESSRAVYARALRAYRDNVIRVRKQQQIDLRQLAQAVEPLLNLPTRSGKKFQIAWAGQQLQGLARLMMARAANSKRGMVDALNDEMGNSPFVLLLSTDAEQVLSSQKLGAYEYDFEMLGQLRINPSTRKVVVRTGEVQYTRDGRFPTRSKFTVGMLVYNRRIHSSWHRSVCTCK
jgi:hypothetical protein